MSLDEFFEKFLLFEHEKGLFNIEICNVRIWELIRNPVFYILKKKLVSDNVNFDNNNVKSALQGLKEYVSNVYFSQNNTKIEETEILFLNHPRRRLIDDFYTEIYTDTFLPFIPYQYKVIEGFYGLKHLKPVLTKNVIYLDKIEFPSRLINYLPFNSIKEKKELEIIKKLVEDIDEYFGVRIHEFSSIVNKYISRYQYIYPRLKKLIMKINPKLLVVVISYSLYSQIATIIAKELDIPSAELQHGVVGRLHFAYNFPKRTYIKSFPDFFLTWGKFWVHNARLPIQDSKIIDVGFPYIEKFKIDAAHHIKKENQIVILSQMREDIARFSFELAELLEDYLIIFKAHPTEYLNVHLNFPFLLEKQNIKLIANDEISLYNLFSESSYVIGLNSTAVIESLSFDCRIMILQFPGWEYYQHLNSVDGVYFIKSPDEVKEILVNLDSKKKNNKFNSEYFFKSNSMQNMIDFFTSVLKY